MKNVGNMENEIRNISDLNGKTIIETIQYLGDLWVKFSDNTFCVFVVNDITEPFGHRKEEVNLCKYGKDMTDIPLLDLGLITKEQYDKACEEEEIRYKKLEEERELEREERIIKMELDQLEKLKKKYT